MRCLLPTSMAFLIAFVPGCADPEASSPAGEVTFADSSGIRLVTSEGPLWGDRTPWLVEAEPLVSIGIADGPEEYLLHRVRAATRTTQGRLVIASTGGGHSVRVYAPDGTYLRTLGRAGQGQGEFRQPAQIHVAPGDTLRVWDLGNLRINWFDPDGGFVRDRSIDLATFQLQSLRQLPASAMVGASLLPDGAILVRLAQISGGPPGEGLVRSRHTLLRSSGDLSRWDTVAAFLDVEEMRVLVASDRGSANIGFSPPQAKRGSVTFGGVPSRVCLGEQDHPEVRCYGQGGGELRIRWSAPRQRVSEGDLASWRAGIDEQPPDVRSALAAMPIPTFRPAYGRLFMDRHENLWVETPRALDARTGPVAYQVFDREGRWLGGVTLPPLQPLEIGDDYVIGLHRDELGVESVRVHRLLRSEG